MKHKYDAIIIGTGAGGGTIGHALSKKGLKILFIEKGLINKDSLSGQYSEIYKSHNIDNNELEFLRLNLKYGPKCRKKAFLKKGFKVGTPEYKDCVLKKGRL